MHILLSYNVRGEALTHFFQIINSLGTTYWIIFSPVVGLLLLLSFKFLNIPETVSGLSSVFL